MAIEIFHATPTPPTPSVATTAPSDQSTQPPTPISSSWAMNMMSPRISFSHDLNQGTGDVVPVEPHLPLNTSSLVASANFNFYYPNNNAPLNDRHYQSSSADELFCDGVLRPLENLNIRSTDKAQQQQPTAKNRRPASLANPKSPPPKIRDGSDKQLSQQEQQSRNTKSFWKFKRSRSFHCGSIYGGTLCPLPLLSRSKSTGSNSSSKRSLVVKEEQGGDYQGNRKLGGCGSNQRNSSPSFATGRYFTSKNKSYYHGHSVSPNITVVVSPVLNVPAGNLFGIGSIFCSGGRRKRGGYYEGKNKKKTGQEQLN